MLFSHRPRTDEFEAAALPHMNDIYRTAARLLGNGTGADDVVQDVYLQAWKSFEQFELGTNCRAWLFKILFHTLHHYRRKWLNRFRCELRNRHPDRVEVRCRSTRRILSRDANTREK
jgi:RNA polymerase sigma-70 factor (ECF subfamily)